MPRIYRHLFHVNKRTFWGDRRCGRGGAEFKQVKQGKLGGVSFFKNEKIVGWATCASHQVR